MMENLISIIYVLGPAIAFYLYFFHSKSGDVRLGDYAKSPISQRWHNMDKWRKTQTILIWVIIAELTAWSFLVHPLYGLFWLLFYMAVFITPYFWQRKGLRRAGIKDGGQ